MAVLRAEHLGSSYQVPVRAAGAATITAGAAVLIGAFTQFAADGLGIPAPVAPTERVVVRGPYR